MNQKTWILLNEHKPHTVNEVIQMILKNRNIDDLEKFIDVEPPQFYFTNQFFDKTFHEQLSKAKSMILQAIEENNAIIIHGDYDADGQTATAILYRTIKNDLNYQNIFTYIPNRFDEGYGLSSESLMGMKDMLKKNNQEISGSLIITVDCGIVSNKEVETAKKDGFKVIITDHHQPSSELPKSDALVWSDKSTGAGLAWLISFTLLDQPKYMDLAAIGTICDLQPLTNFNRSLAKYGLEALNTNPNLGIRELCKTAGVEKEIIEYTVGWVIGPRLNATGRLENASQSLQLLLTDSVNEAHNIAIQLNQINVTRQEKTKQDLETAIADYVDKKIPKFIITKSATFHEGVIGLVAGKMVQTYYRPSIAIALEENSQIVKGSARSIEGISIIETLRKFDHYFEKLGGHDMAAGFSLKIENIEKLYDSLNDLDQWDEDIFKPKLKIDCEINPDLLNIELLENVQKLKPFGIGNQEPIFKTSNFRIFNYQYFGKENNHLKLYLNDENGSKYNAILFGAVDYPAVSDLRIGQKIDLAYNLSENKWNNTRALELKVKDLVTH